MDQGNGQLVLKDAHVIDPAQGIDRVADVVISDGRIVAVGSAPLSGDASVLNLAGHYLSPGWVDLHVHAYGTLGFGDPDSIGIYQGVTSFVDAGGTGIDSLDEFVALFENRLVTSLYAGPLIRPIGMVGLSYIDDEARSIRNVPIARWLDWAEAHPDVLRYVKAGAYSPQGRAPLTITKGVAELLGLPLYLHIGEYQVEADLPSTVAHAFHLAEAGDIVTHIYHNNRGCLLDADGRVQPFVMEAARRGVLFDIGFGGYNFSWDVAEKGFAQGLVPHLISSDLQQFNVCTPVYSLANVMSVCLHLGLGLAEVVASVTSRPAAALSLEDRAGSLKPGAPADITVFRVESGDFMLEDCYKAFRKADRRFVPVMAFKDGRRFDSDMMRAQDERNWFMNIDEEKAPKAHRLSSRQVEFLAVLADALSRADWVVLPARQVDLEKATALQDIFHDVRQQQGLPLRDALTAVYDCFLEDPFTMQIGLFLVRLDRSFAIGRLNQVAGRKSVVA